ncbi:MAG: S8 family serine peptidase [Candidatus Eisenbacteria bacterium]|uniref:S8 family serine peptidase n=1 Tax=Eiseniibacteriota bacterium TaxID=2212470 RepID=A0A933W945_UNCEI|nr:S8 family serine peptidase [Candidatus Eisenbacteria bacterium]
MRPLHTLLAPTALALTIALAVPHTAGTARAATGGGTARFLVAQLAEAPDAAPAGALASTTTAQRLAALGLTVRAPLRDGTMRARAARLDAAVLAHPALRDFAPERIVLLEAPDSALAARARTALVEGGAVDWVEPLAARALQMTELHGASARPAAVAALDSLPNDPLLRDTRQWGLWNVGGVGGGFYGGVPRADAHVVEAWRVTTGSNTLKLAVADTGIDPAQPELAGLMPDGSPRLSDPVSVTFEGADAWADSNGHGTPVAGAMAARTNDGAHFASGGVAGVCGGDGALEAGCRIVPIKIASGHSGESSSFEVSRAMLWAADVGARAMNLSFAGYEGSRLERLCMTYALLRGCVVVVAAGNEGARDNPRRPMYPAAYAADGLGIQVGASTQFDDRATFSSYGPGLDFVAPGVNIWTTFMTYPSSAGASYDGLVAASGTSFAAPIAAGAVGLLAAARPELIENDFQHVLRESADDVYLPGWDERTAWGRLNVGRALASVGPEYGIWHDEVRADSVALAGAGTLSIGEDGPGTLDRFRGLLAATRWATYATVTLPDSFADSVRVWPRVGGTFAARGDFQLPYFTPGAEVVSRQGRTFTLRGWLYRADGDTCAACTDAWVPLPPEYVRFGFTVIGRVNRARPPVTAGDADGTAARAVRAGPSPFRGALALALPGAGHVRVLDVSGRVLRAWDATDGSSRWDGRDRDGRDAPPGLYFVTWTAPGAGTLRTRVVKLGR